MKKIRTKLNAGKIASNHNAKKTAVKVRTSVRSGRLASNHNAKKTATKRG